MSENGIHRTNHEDHEATQNQLREEHHAVSSSESISDEVALATIDIFFVHMYEMQSGNMLFRQCGGIFEIGKNGW